ncbi:unnamed protein product [Zymoseptoria tritici ST99CH_1A5]|uniref:Uncharacterized protein n=1 Tax=Zymoseptoria tritici ST99CH_1A5 TaxID=1276529 RepID=A0A1Y6LYG7_ZYMTR|nr:unnamed protein product [Zymoseptoria tritici ST99CH_1A5]
MSRRDYTLVDERDDEVVAVFVEHFSLKINGTMTFRRELDAKAEMSALMAQVGSIKLPRDTINDITAPNVYLPRPMSRYRSFSGALIDPEKQRRGSEDSIDAHDYLSSSQPMLGQGAARAPTYAYHLPRRRFSRYFTLAISAIIGFFIWYLVRASLSSRAAVELGIGRPAAPPPAWEGFPFLKRYHGGIRTLVSREDNTPEYPVAEDVEVQRLVDAAMEQKKKADAVTSKEKGFNKKREIPEVKEQVAFPLPHRFDPYPKYGVEGDRKGFAPPVKCYVDEKEKREVPQLLAFNGTTKGFPDPVMGSYDLLGLRKDVCFERHGRLGPYGFGYSKKFGGSGAGMDGDREGAEHVWGDELEIDYRNVKWAEVQDKCEKDNAHRFKAPPKQRLNHFFTSMASGGPVEEKQNSKRAEEEPKVQESTDLLNRTVVLIRTWESFEYDAEDMFYLRALVNELSIQSGTEYVVHFLIHVKDNDAQIWADDETYQRVLERALPAEFKGMGTLWSERQMGLIYGGLAESNYRDLQVHGAYRSTYMPVQYFAHMHPEYDFIWHWEMDVRYTGHFYHLFQKVSQWAKQQPRKGLWERNGRFYVPAEHGSWEDFRHMVRIQTEHGTASKENIYGKLASDAGVKNPMDVASHSHETPVWGPLRPSGEGDTTADPDNDPQPPTVFDKDNYEWGVGEEADFITFNPLFDPHKTNWILAEDVTGYNTTEGYPPRRTAIITASRLSHRLLETMHRETTLQRHTMFSEMWPGSCALHHGYKAVYAPHPVYIDRAWPTSYLAAVFNNGRNGATGGARTSVFSDERQHNFLGTTWYYHAGFPANLWKRWLGYKVDNDGGEEWELANEGRMCLPAMLLHPIKQVDLIVEHLEGEPV